MICINWVVLSYIGAGLSGLIIGVVMGVAWVATGDIFSPKGGDPDPSIPPDKSPHYKRVSK